MVNPGKRPAGVEPVRSDAHKVEAAYSGDDIAMGVTYQIQIGERRSIVVQTHVGRGDDPKQLNALFDKVMAATDRVHAVYRLQELQREHKLLTKQFAMSLDNLSETKARWQAEWERKSKRGPVELAGNQREIETNTLKQHDRFRAQLAELEQDIQDLEKLIGK